MQYTAPSMQPDGPSAVNTLPRDMPKPQVLTVSQLNRQAKSLLESHFDFVWVGGELSNFAQPASGHWYFTLKDGNAQVRCAMFRNRNQRLRFTPEQGDEIRVRCRVSLYEGRGEFQLIVEHMELAGAGALQAAYEKLKARLQAEGLFEPERKRELPGAPSALGVITSARGAAIHDILTVLERRWPAIEVYVLQVQGEGAAEQVAAAIELANRAVAAGAVSLDALIVGRGGGSLEDLWAFNEEVVARAIAHSELPIVSAVGHEVDFSIADFVADRRAPTPSAAAELLSPDRDEWLQVLEGTRYTLLQQVNQKLGHLGQELRHLRRRLRHPGSLLREQAQRVDDLEQRLRRAQAGILLQSRNHHAMLGNRLRAQSPLMRVQQLQRSHADTRRRLLSAMQQNLAGTRQRVAALAQVLDSLSPLGVLGRGFAVLRDDRGNIVSDAAAVRVGDEVSARLARGQLDLTVTRVVPGEDQGQD